MAKLLDPLTFVDRFGSLNTITTLTPTELMMILMVWDEPLKPSWVWDPKPSGLSSTDEIQMNQLNPDGFGMFWIQFACLVHLGTCLVVAITPSEGHPQRLRQYQT